MSPRTVVLALLVLLAGCSAGPTTTPTDCTANPLSESGALNESTRKVLPSPPDSLDEPSAREYAIAYEEAALWNHEYEADMTQLRVEVLDATARSTGDGFEVVLDVELGARHDDNSISDDGWTAAYLLDGNSVKRGEGSFGADSPPAPERTVACWV